MWMENLTIKETNRTPGVNFNFDGNIRLNGRSIPEDPGLFYTMLYAWVFQYCQHPALETQIYIEMEYMNSGSAKSILQILRELSAVNTSDKKLTIYWYYEIGDEDMLEKGEYFQTILNHEFKFIETY